MIRRRAVAVDIQVPLSLQRRGQRVSCAGGQWTSEDAEELWLETFKKMDAADRAESSGEGNPMQTETGHEGK